MLVGAKANTHWIFVNNHLFKNKHCSYVYFYKKISNPYKKVDKSWMYNSMIYCRVTVAKKQNFQLKSLLMCTNLWKLNYFSGFFQEIQMVQSDIEIQSFHLCKMLSYPMSSNRSDGRKERECCMVPLLIGGAVRAGFSLPELGRVFRNFLHRSMFVDLLKPASLLSKIH